MGSPCKAPKAVPERLRRVVIFCLCKGRSLPIGIVDFGELLPDVRIDWDRFLMVKSEQTNAVRELWADAWKVDQMRPCVRVAGSLEVRQ